MQAFDSKYREWQAAAKSYRRENLQQVYHKYREIFDGEPVPIAWRPDPDSAQNSNLGQSIKQLGFENYQQLFSWAAENRAAFWDYAVKKLNIKFKREYEKVLELPNGIEDPSWFSGASMNIVESCFQGNDSQTAIIEGSENGPELIKITYSQLREKVERFAGGLSGLGFKPGDAVVIYAPLSSEAIIGYLALIKLGLVPVSVADSFSAEELKKRIAISKAKAVLASAGYIYGGKQLNLYEKVREATDIPAIVFGAPSSLRATDIHYQELLNSAPVSGYHYSEPDSNINILFSSGTTKEPKAIPFTHLTPVKCAADGYFHQDIRENDVVTWTTGMGWMMAPWLIFAGLLNRATVSVFAGAPTCARYCDFLKESGTTILGTVPSIVRAWKKHNFHLKADWSIRLFTSTGEPSNAADYFYLMALADFQAPLIEYCGGTEIGGGYITGTVLQPVSPTLFTTPTLGLDFYLIKPDGKVAGDREVGETFIVPPAVGLSQKLLNKDHHQEYYEGVPKGPKGETLRRHGDAFEVMHYAGMTFYKSVGRTDDVMNLGGIKISAVEIEETLNRHEAVFETAAVSVQEKDGLEKLVVFAVPARETEDIPALKQELQNLINTRLNPFFKIAEVRLIDELPRTASNKLMRRGLRARIPADRKQTLDAGD